jgi:hypothetical protein
MAGTLPVMRIRHAVALLLVVAAACGGNPETGRSADDYFTKLERTSQTAHIQERGLRRDLRIRLESAPAGEDRLTVVTVYVDQGARLYQDVVDALGQLDPPSELAAAQQAYADAWQGQLDLFVAIRDAGFSAPWKILKELERPAFRDASTETKTRCEDLQTAVDATGSQVDLACSGVPS